MPEYETNSARNMDLLRQYFPRLKWKEHLAVCHHALIVAYRGTKTPREIAEEAVCHAKAMAERLVGERE